MVTQQSSSAAASTQEQEASSLDKEALDKESSLRVVDDPHKVPLYNPHVDVSAVDERKLLRKIDLRLVPWLALLYLLSFLDRTGIGKWVPKTASIVASSNHRCSAKVRWLIHDN